MFRKRNRSLTFESLEVRRVFAANPITLNGDVIHVRGTSHADVINVERVTSGPNLDKVHVTLNDREEFFDYDYNGTGTGSISKVVIEGLGIGANSTAEALAKLPAPVTLAFAPYGTDLERWVARARRENHEVLLQVGMEPFDYPDNDPGPQTLLASLTPEQNLDRLHWFLSRFQGYVGVTSLMGARFTAADQALGPVIREIGKRGLIYFDDGSSPRSAASQTSGASNVAFARADAVLDAVPTAAEIDNALARLEATARNRGVAIGAASALPVSIERIAQWAKAAESRGIVLVPVSMVANRAKTGS